MDLIPSPQAARRQIRRSQAQVLDAWLDELGGLDFRGFIEKAFPGFVWLHYRSLIVDRLQDFVDGELLLPNGDRADKIFIALRTQTGKSTMAQLFAAFLMTKFPGIIQGAAMHNEKLTNRFSRNVRNFVVAGGGRLVGKALHNWYTDRSSEFWAMTKNSRPSGMPAHVLFGDDLLGGAKEALSQNVAADDIEWLASEFLKRKAPLHPKLGRFLQVAIGTRWSLTDVQAYWLSLGGWYCVIIPTVYDPDNWPIEVKVGPFNLDDDPEFRTEPWDAPNCAIEPDWREVGEGLDESVEEYSAATFHASRRINGGSLSEARIAAIEQGCPRPAAGGGIMYASWFTELEVEPIGWDRSVRAWDFGSTAGGGDPSASCKMGYLDGLYPIRHGCRAWLGSSAVLQLVAAMMLLDGPETTVVVPVALAEAGKISLAGIRKYLRQVAAWAGVPCAPVRGKSVRNKGKPENFRSAKHQRVAYPGGSLAEAARPADWDGPGKPFSVPGDVQIVMADWRPGLRELIPDFAKRAASHPELLEIEKLALAATGQATVEECKVLGVDSKRWQPAMLGELHNFSGYDGGQDHYPDAAADAKTVISRVGGWSISGV